MKEQTTDRLQQLHRWFLEHGQTLSLAESCTGGMLSALITSQPGASAYYLGAIVSYASAVKTDILGVPRSMIQVHGEVSLPVALEMARGVKETLDSRWSVSITGIAGPDGGSPDKPVGTVCFAVCGPGFEDTKQMHFEGKGRHEIQEDSVDYALEFLWNSIHF